MAKLPAGWIIFPKANLKGITMESTDLILCEDCKFFERNHFDTVNGIPLITAHNICTKWGNGCVTNPDGYCFMGIKEDK